MLPPKARFPHEASATTRPLPPCQLPWSTLLCRWTARAHLPAYLNASSHALSMLNIGQPSAPACSPAGHSPFWNSRPKEVGAPSRRIYPLRQYRIRDANGTSRTYRGSLVTTSSGVVPKLVAILRSPQRPLIYSPPGIRHTGTPLFGRCPTSGRGATPLTHPESAGVSDPSGAALDAGTSRGNKAKHF